MLKNIGTHISRSYTIFRRFQPLILSIATVLSIQHMHHWDDSSRRSPTEGASHRVDPLDVGESGGLWPLTRQHVSAWPGKNLFGRSCKRWTEGRIVAWKVEKVHFFGKFSDEIFLLFLIISLILGGIILAWYHLCKSPKDFLGKDCFLTLEEHELHGGRRVITGGLEGRAGRAARASYVSYHVHWRCLAAAELLVLIS